MLKEAIQELIGLGAKTKAIQIVPHPAGPNAALLLMPDGTYQTIPHDAPARKHAVTDMRSLKSALECYSDIEGSAMWVSFGEVVVILNDNDFRDDRITLRLTASPIFQSLAGFGTVNDPKKLYRFLKHDCNGAGITPADLDLLISNLKFRTEDELSREVGKTADKMGQTIRSEVSGADKIPDLVVFDFLPWPSIEEEYQSPVEVPCQLYIDPAERTISLKPLPGMIEAAKTHATTQLAATISDKWKLTECPVFCGTP